MMTTKIMRFQFPKSHPHFLLMQPSASLMLFGFAAFMTIESNSVFNIIYGSALRVFATFNPHKDVSGHNVTNEENHL